MSVFRRLLSIGLGMAAGAAAIKLLKNKQETGVFELSEKDYIEIPLEETDPSAKPDSTENHSV